MRNVARLTDGDRSDLFRNTANKMGINDAIVEKDYKAMRNMIYCDVPSFEQVLLGLKDMENEINTL